ncbi:hypothetical protein Cva_00009 [Caedimonas varicaedens]|uniref:Uncharacterized protein n=1 Tax=Caedimonas varicaedens TaxID=1629334 RepID=A0A0K8MB10_9PROT|nr:hypothetical protein Cva_00009 [Caedimonas varicaedens]
MLIEKEHDLPNGLLILPTFNNHPGTMRADTGHSLKDIRCILDDVKDFNTKRLHQLLAIHGANAFNQAGTEIFLNPFFRSWGAGFQKRSFELQTIVFVIEPLSRDLNEFSRRNGIGMTHYCHQIFLSLCLNSQHTIPRIRIMIRDFFHKTG